MNVFISGGEIESSPELVEIRKTLINQLEAEGKNVLPPLDTQQLRKNGLTYFDKSGISDADAHIFIGKPDNVTLYLIYHLLEMSQAKLGVAMKRNSDGELQTDAEGNVFRKPIILFQTDGAHNPLLDRANDLKRNGGISAPITDIADIVTNLPDISEKLNAERPPIKMFTPPPMEHEETEGVPYDNSRPQIAICCGFSLKSTYAQAAVKQTAELLAQNGFDIKTGGGRGGLMQEAQLAAYHAGANVTGTTFAALNPLAEHPGKGSKTFGISNMIAVETPHERIENIVGTPQGVLIQPGGYGSDKECIAPLLLKRLRLLSQATPIVIQNLINPETGQRYIDSLITMLKDTGFEEGKDFTVVNPNLVLKSNSEEVDIEASAKKAAEETLGAFKARYRVMTELLEKKTTLSLPDWH